MFNDRLTWNMETACRNTGTRELLFMGRVFNSFDSGDINKKTLPARTVITLPSYQDAPQASPDLIRDDEFDNGMEKVVLSTWQLDGLSLPPKEAVALLTSRSGFWI